MVPTNYFRGHPIQEAEIVSRFGLLGTGTLEGAIRTVLVENDGGRLRRGVGRPTSDALDDRGHPLVNRLKTGAVALTISRYKMSSERRFTLKLSQHVAGNGQIDHLLLFNTVRSNYERWLIGRGTACAPDLG